MPPPTKRELRQIYRARVWVAAFEIQKENKKAKVPAGPTYVEIVERTGLIMSNVRYALRELEADGTIQRDRERYRSIVVTKAPTKAAKRLCAAIYCS